MDGSTTRKRWMGDAPVFHRDPLLIAATVWTLAATVLFFVFDSRPNAQVQTYWAFQPALDLHSLLSRGMLRVEQRSRIQPTSWA